jgi:tetratricopeptide (TPR) repeat protein
LLAEADLFGAKDPATSRTKAEQALKSGHLDSADAHFARALLATDTHTAIEELRQTLVIKPSQLQARRMLIGVFLICGRFDEAQQVAERGRDFAPEDSSDLLVAVFRDSLRGQPERARQTLDKAGTRLDPTTRESFEATVQLLSDLPQITDPNGDILTTVSTATLIRNVSKLLISTNQVSGLTLPFGLRNAYGNVAKSLPLFLLGDLEPLATRILAVHRDGFTLYLVGSIWVMKHRFKEAETILLEAAKTPSLIDLRKTSRIQALRCGFQMWRYGNLPEKDRAAYRERIGDSISILLDLDDKNNDHLFMFGQIAWQIGNFPVLRRVAETWKITNPKDFGPEMYLAYQTLETGYPLNAIEHAARAFFNRKNGADPFVAEGISVDQEPQALIRRGMKVLGRQGLRRLGSH